MAGKPAEKTPNIPSLHLAVLDEGLSTASVEMKRLCPLDFLVLEHKNGRKAHS